MAPASRRCMSELTIKHTTMTETTTTFEHTNKPNLGLHRLALTVVVATFILILAGGNVTSKGAGLAVRDWPLSFGSFNPQGWTGMPLVRDEHGHRLIGAIVGVLTIMLTIWFWKAEPRRHVRRLAYAALFAVIVQGLMGGFRVTELSIALAVIHGCFAHVFFCMVVVLAMMTSPKWQYDKSIDNHEPKVRPMRRWTFGLLAVVFAQLVLGAVLRHTGFGYVVFWHMGGALLIGISLLQASNFVFTEPVDERLTQPVIAIFIMYGLQIILGVVTYLLLIGMETRPAYGLWETYLPTVHVALGALILAKACTLAVRVAATTSLTTENHPMREALA